MSDMYNHFPYGLDMLKSTLHTSTKTTAESFWVSRCKAVEVSCSVLVGRGIEGQRKHGKK